MKVLSEEDKLYKLPDSIKPSAPFSSAGGGDEVRDSIAAGTAATETDIASGASAGILEVALPISFKLKNIEETEVALTSARERARMLAASAAQSAGNFRFQRGFAGVDERRGDAMPPYQHAGATGGSGGNDGDQGRASNNGEQRSFKRSNDDKAMDRFKKVSYY